MNPTSSKFQSFDVIVIAALVAIVLVVALSSPRPTEDSTPPVTAAIEAPTPKPSAPPLPMHTNMPPGFTLVCDLERGVYSAKWGEFGEFSWAYQPVDSNRQAIIDRAWRTHYEYKRTNTAPKEMGFRDYNWRACE